jgi:hypothetical protein
MANNKEQASLIEEAFRVKDLIHLLICKLTDASYDVCGLLH